MSARAEAACLLRASPYVLEVRITPDLALVAGDWVLFLLKCLEVLNRRKRDVRGFVVLIVSFLLDDSTFLDVEVRRLATVTDRLRCALHSHRFIRAGLVLLRHTRRVCLLLRCACLPALRDTVDDFHRLLLRAHCVTGRTRRLIVLLRMDHDFLVELLIAIWGVPLHPAVSRRVFGEPCLAPRVVLLRRWQRCRLS